MFISAKRQKFGSAIAVFLMGLAILVSATSSKAEPTFPELNGRRVVDEANIISPEVEADLTAKLKGLEDATTDQVIVVTVNSLDGYEIEDYGYQLGRYWKVGQSGKVEASNGQTYKDNGLLIIVAPNERKVRIEVGYGLEPVMTDALSSMIIRNVIVPKFRTGDYEGGIVGATDAVIEQLSLDRQVAIQKAQEAQSAVATQSVEKIPGWVIFLAIIIFIILLRSGLLPWIILSNLGGGGGWSGGGGFGGGGGFSGGGGSFGGGGSSGSW